MRTLTCANQTTVRILTYQYTLTRIFKIYEMRMKCYAQHIQAYNQSTYLFNLILTNYLINYLNSQHQ